MTTTRGSRHALKEISTCQSVVLLASNDTMAKVWIGYRNVSLGFGPAYKQRMPCFYIRALMALTVSL
jgi:hypothetical protein